MRPRNGYYQPRAISAHPSQSIWWFSSLAFCIGLAALATSLLMSSAASANERLLAGRAFATPDAIVPMGEDWKRKGITHTTPEPVDLAVALDQQLYPAFGPLIETFAKERGVRIAVQNGTCGTSAGVLSEKSADIGGFCCPPGDTDRLPGLKFHTIGIAALALIAHPTNPIDDLTLDQARSLFGNDVRNWSELPMSGVKAGPDERVRALARLHCKIRPGHWRLILDTEQQFGWDITEVSAIKDMVQQVSILPGAIGYETLWHLDRLEHKDGSKVKTLSINGTKPQDAQALARGQYPLYRVFNITTWSNGPAHNTLSDELAAYLVEQGGRIAAQYAIVPASDLRRNGWTFKDTELVAEPN